MSNKIQFVWRFLDELTLPVILRRLYKTTLIDLKQKK